MENLYSQTFTVRWSETDSNGHMRHSAYSDYAVEVRMRFLREHDITPSRLRELGIGPVIMFEENRYLREVLMGEDIIVNMKISGISADGSRWRFQHEVKKSNGKLAAILKVEGCWFDLTKRRLTAPPEDFKSLLNSLVRTEDWAWIEP